MEAADVRRLLVVLHGYWPTSAPEDDDLTIAAFRDLLAGIDFDTAVAAARQLALAGREFCPPPGVIAAEATATPDPVPPYYTPYAELEEAPDPEPDPEGVKAAFAEARARLRVIRGEKDAS